MGNRAETTKGRRISIVTLTVLVLVAILLIFSLLDLAWAGSTFLSLSEVWHALIGDGSWANNIIVTNRNLPRIAAALIIGAGLAVTGCVMQAVFRNPLATPYILGLSSGGSLGAAIAIVLLPVGALSFAQPALAFVMCLATTLLVYIVSRAGGGARTETLVLAGVAISSLFSALVSFLTYVAPSDKIGNIIFWTMGSLSNVGTDELAIIVPIVVVGTLIMLTQCRNLNAMMIGDSHAMDLGVDVRRVRIGLLVVSSLVVAACVAFAGTIGFVGLVIPHILRMILGPDNRLILPLSALGGAALLVICDWAAHAVAPLYGVLPIGVVTAIIGAPFFIYLLVSRRREVGW